MQRRKFPGWWSMLVLCSGLWAFAPASRAHACSIATCSLRSVAPSGGTIPANAPALVFVAPPGTTVTPNANLILTTLDGQTLPFTSEPDPTLPGAFLIHPVTPLQPGAAYRLVGVGSCIEGQPIVGLNSAFYVGPAADLPTTFGPVNPHAPELQEILVPDDSSCSAQRQVSAALLEVSSPQSPPPYAQLTRSTLKVDGQVWRTAGYGEAMPAMPYQVCNGDNAYGLPGGHHQGELSIHVAGATVDPPPATFEFDLGCGAVGGKGYDVVVPPPHDGCAIAGGPGSGAVGWLGGLSLLALAAATAHRRRAGG